MTWSASRSGHLLNPGFAAPEILQYLSHHFSKAFGRDASQKGRSRIFAFWIIRSLLGSGRKLQIANAVCGLEAGWNLEGVLESRHTRTSADDGYKKPSSRIGSL
jgi:hypothetical protein